MKRLLLMLVFTVFLASGCDSRTDGLEADNPVVTLELENGAEISIELYPDAAPNTVNNFVHLVQQGFYDGLTFHRIVPRFVIQGGCPLGNGTGNPGWFIRGEFSQNGFENPLKHQRGTVSMARRGDGYDTAGSQFFVVVEDADHLDGAYAAFGQVLKGMGEVDRIVEEHTVSQPVQTVKIVRARVTLNGWNLEEPEKIR